jgi:hypothetical protein
MTSPRKFLLSDALVFVAATAVGFFVVRPYYAVAPIDWTPPFAIATRFVGWIGCVWNCLVLASPIVMAWTLATRAGRALGWFWIVTLPLTCWWEFHARF